MNTEISTPATGITIPSAYQRGVRFGAYWTLIISPYLPLYLLLIILIGGVDGDNGAMGHILEFAGKTPWAFSTTVILDGLFHVLFFATVVTLFAVLRAQWPVWASLLLVCGAWQAIVGFTKVLISHYMFTSLGAAYIAGDANLKAVLVAVAAGESGLRQALQDMDSYGVAAVWLLIALLPAATGLPRPVRWLSWVLAAALLAPDPGFLLVIGLSPVWLFVLGRWLKSLAPTTMRAFDTAKPELAASATGTN